jgi:hypothetical protein
VSVLRRIAADLRQHHWTGVAIELLIVVLGVFIGLQAANWNEERKDRALARQYLERLREDFVLSAEGAQSNIDNMQSQATKAAWMLDHLQRCSLADGAEHAQFASALYVMGRIEPPTIVRGTIDELRSTGRIGMVGSVGLRRALSDVTQLQQRNSEVLAFIAARRSAMLAYVDARSTFPAQTENGVAPVDGPVDVRFDFPALCRDPTYINAVSHLGQAAAVVVGQHRRLLAQYQAMVVTLDAELQKDPP